MAHEFSELSAYLDGELPDADRRAVEARLATDPEYARELERLTRIKDMMTLCIEQPAFHAAVMRRIQKEEGALRTHAQFYRRAALSAAAVLLLAVAVLASVVLGRWPTDRPPHAEPPVAQTPAVTVESNQEPAEPAAETPPTTEPAPPAVAVEPPAETTQLALKLTGTVTGSMPMAVLTVGDGAEAKSRTYAVGDTVMDGVTLVAVEPGKAILDNNGQQVVLTQNAIAAPSPVNLSGDWLLIILEDGQPSEDPVPVTVTQQGDSLMIASADLLVVGTLSGNRVLATVTLRNGEPIQVEGLINAGGTEITGSVPQKPREDGAVPQVESMFRLTKIPQDVTDTRRLYANRYNEVAAMFAALDRYRRAHQPNFPEALAELVPDYQPDLRLFADTAERRVTYRKPTPVTSATLAAMPKLEDISPSLPLQERLIQWEQRLKDDGYDAVLKPVPPMLTASYTNPAMKLCLSPTGNITEDTGGLAPTFDNTPAGQERLVQARASCQNNLKQLGLVIKMFMNEHSEYTPPGWLSVYPEYLADPRVLNSPKDAPGTDSYVLLLPAADTPELIGQANPDPSNPAAKAKAESEIPVVCNRTDWPTPDAGRNVLFLDGHVEYLTHAAWVERVQPYMPH